MERRKQGSDSLAGEVAALAVAAIAVGVMLFLLAGCSCALTISSSAADPDLAPAADAAATLAPSPHAGGPGRRSRCDRADCQAPLDPRVEWSDPAIEVGR